MFEDREDAGRQLAKKLEKYKKEDVVVLAIPRGGLPLGALVAERLDAPMDVALSKKIGHPFSKEYAIGAVSLEDRILTEAMGVTKAYIEEETIRVRRKLQRRYNQYYKKSQPLNLRGKTVIIVDDGIATGNTILITVALVAKQKPTKIVVGIPVASKSALEKISTAKQNVEIVCLSTPRHFRAVGQFYQYFPQVSDEKAIQIFNSHKAVSP